MLTQEQIWLAIESAIQKLMDEDCYLFVVDVNERTLTHRMAIYLEEKIREMDAEWNIDCEYNRDVTSPEKPYSKRLRLTDDPPPRDYDNEPYQDENATTVFPDIIVHRRGRSGEQNGNLAVIEVKKTTSSVSTEYDKKKKLPAYLKYLKYKYAYFITLHTGNECNCTVELIGQQD